LQAIEFLKATSRHAAQEEILACLAGNRAFARLPIRAVSTDVAGTSAETWHHALRIEVRLVPQVSQFRAKPDSNTRTTVLAASVFRRAFV
jgi:hypothetical protein